MSTQPGCDISGLFLSLHSLFTLLIHLIRLASMARELIRYFLSVSSYQVTEKM